MDERVVELKNTINELILNINIRIDGICSVYKDTGIFEEDRLQCLFDDLQALAEGVDFLKNYYSDMDLFDFQEKLDMMERALDTNDRLLFIDIIQFELKGLLESWQEPLT
jgi:hypothetical protein